VQVQGATLADVPAEPDGPPAALPASPATATSTTLVVIQNSVQMNTGRQGYYGRRYNRGHHQRHDQRARHPVYGVTTAIPYVNAAPASGFCAFKAFK